MARTQFTVAVATTMTKIVSANPRRTGLLLQNRSGDTFTLFAQEDDSGGGITLYTTAWFYFDRSTDADKAWYAKGVAGDDIEVMEFYEERRRR